MAEIRTDQLLLPSVLDRLIDNDPQVRQEAPGSRSQLLRELKQAVRRDLENLLNTRIRCLPFPREFSEFEQSLVSYGISRPDRHTMASPRNARSFDASSTRSFSTYEPRLKKPHRNAPRSS